jgi:hypothetical protein
MISVNCTNFNSVGVQEPKLHKTDENGHLDGECPSRLSANKAHQIWEPLASQIYLSGKRRTLGSGGESKVAVSSRTTIWYIADWVTSLFDDDRGRC